MQAAPDREPVLQRIRAGLRDASSEFLAEALTALWRGALIALGLLPVIAGLLTLWTLHRPAWDVFAMRILLAHSGVCFLLGCAIVVVGARYELVRYHRETGLSWWYKAAAGLAAVGFAGLAVLKLVVVLWPRLLP